MIHDEECVVNKPGINRSILRMHIAAIEATHPINIVGLRPRGAAAHVFDAMHWIFLLRSAPDSVSWVWRKLR
jgi:hypothetical protein